MYYAPVLVLFLLISFLISFLLTFNLYYYSSHNESDVKSAVLSFSSISSSLPSSSSSSSTRNILEKLLPLNPVSVILSLPEASQSSLYEYYPRCERLYTALFDDNYFKETRELLGSGFEANMYQPEFNLRIHREKHWRGNKAVSLSSIQQEMPAFLLSTTDVWNYVAEPHSPSGISPSNVLSPPSFSTSLLPSPPFQQEFSGNYDKLLIVAHPDDETVFGFIDLLAHKEKWDTWKEEQEQLRKRAKRRLNSTLAEDLILASAPPVGWKVVVLTHSYSSSTRVIELSRALNYFRVFHYEILGHLDTLNADLKIDTRAVQKIATIIYERPWKKIVTHNLAGEYGHIQHKLLSKIVQSLIFSPPAKLWPISSSGKFNASSFSTGDEWKRHWIDHSNSVDPVPFSVLSTPFAHRLHFFASFEDQQRQQQRKSLQKQWEKESNYQRKQPEGKEYDDRELFSSASNFAPSSTSSSDESLPSFQEQVPLSTSTVLVPPNTITRVEQLWFWFDLNWTPSYASSASYPWESDPNYGLSDLLYRQKVEVLDQSYPSQITNLFARHQREIQFSGDSLPANDNYDFYQYQIRKSNYFHMKDAESARLLLSEVKEFSPESDPKTQWLAWQERTKKRGTVWDWKEWSCDAD